MPGIDGWETIRRIRQQDLTATTAPLHIAILSANAFDKGLENDAGIPSADFIVKPLRVDELLDWIGYKLGLQWVLAQAPAIMPPAPQQAAAAARSRSVVLGNARQDQQRHRRHPRCSPSTVIKHLEHVFEKLGVETRTAAANLAMNKMRGV